MVLTKSLKQLMPGQTKVSHNLSSHCFRLNIFISQNTPTLFTCGTQLRSKADSLVFFVVVVFQKKVSWKNNIKNIQLFKSSLLL